MTQIPVYVFTGFLDAGKTKFIQETLEDERFNAGERTLLLVFEEGEEEYDFSTYPHQNVYLEVLDQQTVTTKQLQQLAKKCTRGHVCRLHHIYHIQRQYAQSCYGQAGGRSNGGIQSSDSWPGHHAAA